MGGCRRLGRSASGEPAGEVYRCHLRGRFLETRTCRRANRFLKERVRSSVGKCQSDMTLDGRPSRTSSGCTTGGSPGGRLMNNFWNLERRTP
jgi:hypothetical protein